VLCGDFDIQITGSSGSLQISWSRKLPVPVFLGIVKMREPPIPTLSEASKNRQFSRKN